MKVKVKRESSKFSRNHCFDWSVFTSLILTDDVLRNIIICLVENFSKVGMTVWGSGLIKTNSEKKYQFHFTHHYAFCSFRGQNLAFAEILNGCISLGQKSKV